jgi:hypothetical protein
MLGPIYRTTQQIFCLLPDSLVLPDLYIEDSEEGSEQDVGRKEGCKEIGNGEEGKKVWYVRRR